jgi:hypothetical protein
LLKVFELLESFKYIVTKEVDLETIPSKDWKKKRLHLNKFMMVRVEDHMCLNWLHSENVWKIIFYV